jgi:hypothetical protein
VLFFGVFSKPLLIHYRHLHGIHRFIFSFSVFWKNRSKPMPQAALEGFCSKLRSNLTLPKCLKVFNSKAQLH